MDRLAQETVSRNLSAIQGRLSALDDTQTQILAWLDSLDVGLNRIVAETEPVDTSAMERVSRLKRRLKAVSKKLEVSGVKLSEIRDKLSER